MSFNWVVAEDRSGGLLVRSQGPRGGATRRACTVRQACRLLHKSRRHVYRYLKRGTLASYGKFLGEWLLDRENVRRLAAWPAAAARLPRRAQVLFPEYSVSRLDLYRDRALILARLLDQGDRHEVAWVLKLYPRREIRGFLLADGARLLSLKSLFFWSLFFGMETPPVPEWRLRGRQWGGA